MILAAGLTPAWQRTLVLDGFQPGEVNRAREAHECASGKVLNVAIALHRLGVDAHAVTLAGGASGRALRRDVEGLGLKVSWIESAAPTRTCTTVLDGARMTELVENASPISPEELEVFMDTCLRQLIQSAQVSVLTGSLPKGAPQEIYSLIIRRHVRRVVLDARGAELLEALPFHPFVVKPNRAELSETVGRDLPDDAAVNKAMAEIRELGAPWVVVTDGAGPVRVLGDGTVRAFQPPKVDPVNPIGCGDSLAAGIAVEVARNDDVIEGVRLGMAAAADNLTRLLPARLDRAAVERLRKEVREL